MLELHVIQVALLNPVLDALRDAGAPVSRYLHEAGFKGLSLQDPEGYVPMARQYALFDVLRRREAIDSAVGVFPEYFHFEALGDWALEVARCPSLLTAVRLGCRYETVNLSTQRLRLTFDGRQSTLSNWFVDAPSPGRMELERQAIKYTVKSIRLTRGAASTPTEVHWTGGFEPWLEALVPLNHTRLRLHAPRPAVVFPSELLTRPMRRPRAAKCTDPGQWAGPGESLGARLRRVLEASTGCAMPTAERLGETFDIGVRTLQRRLSAEGATVRSVVEEWRLEKALDLLAEPDVTVREVAERLHYANSSNFERAFKRWTGTTPGRYRQAH